MIAWFVRVTDNARYRLAARLETSARQLAAWIRFAGK